MSNPHAALIRRIDRFTEWAHEGGVDIGTATELLEEASAALQNLTEPNA